VAEEDTRSKEEEVDKRMGVHHPRSHNCHRGQRVLLYLGVNLVRIKV
jgi:hypothetical protein